MKINRFVGLAAIALLVVGAMGAVSMRVFAQSAGSQVAQTSVQAQDCSQDQADGTEVQTAIDNDNVNLQCGDQNAPDGQQSTSSVEAVDKGGQETVGGQDTDNVNVQEQVGDQSSVDTGTEAPESAAPSGN